MRLAGNNRGSFSQAYRYCPVLCWLVLCSASVCCASRQTQGVMKATEHAASITSLQRLNSFSLCLTDLLELFFPFVCVCVCFFFCLFDSNNNVGPVWTDHVLSRSRAAWVCLCLSRFIALVPQMTAEADA